MTTISQGPSELTWKLHFQERIRKLQQPEKENWCFLYFFLGASHPNIHTVSLDLAAWRKLEVRPDARCRDHSHPQTSSLLSTLRAQTCTL